MSDIVKSTKKTGSTKLPTVINVSRSEKDNTKKQIISLHSKEKMASSISENDYKPSVKLASVKPEEIAQTQVWVMAAVLYAILAFYEFFYRADWIAGVLNILLGAIFISFVWKK